MDFYVKKFKPSAVVPTRGTAGAAGWDISACIDEAITILPGETYIVPTGIGIELPSSDYVAYCFLRSGFGVKNKCANILGTGVIDSDYRGEIFVPVVNHSQNIITIEPMQRIGQLVINHIPAVSCVEVDEFFTETDRGSGGFGSTGKF